MPVPKQCKRCGSGFYNPNSTAKYCSRECSALARRRGETRSCRICGSEFYLSPAQLRARGNTAKYCSLKCNGKAKSLTRTYLTCKQCGKRFYNGHRHLQYCSRECYHTSRRAPGYPSRPLRVGVEFKTMDKRRIVERAGGKCELCGSGRHVEADHIVPVLMGGTNDLNNGQALCRRCHKGKTILELGFTPQKRRTVAHCFHYLGSSMAKFPLAEQGVGLLPPPAQETV